MSSTVTIVFGVAAFAALFYSLAWAVVIGFLACLIHFRPYFSECGQSLYETWTQATSSKHQSDSFGTTSASLVGLAGVSLVPRAQLSQSLVTQDVSGLGKKGNFPSEPLGGRYSRFDSPKNGQFLNNTRNNWSPYQQRYDLSDDMTKSPLGPARTNLGTNSVVSTASQNRKMHEESTDHAWEIHRAMMNKAKLEGKVVPKSSPPKPVPPPSSIATATSSGVFVPEEMESSTSQRPKRPYATEDDISTKRGKYEKYVEFMGRASKRALEESEPGHSAKKQFLRTPVKVDEMTASLSSSVRRPARRVAMQEDSSVVCKKCKRVDDCLDDTLSRRMDHEDSRVSNISMDETKPEVKGTSEQASEGTPIPAIVTTPSTPKSVKVKIRPAEDRKEEKDETPLKIISQEDLQKDREIDSQRLDAFKKVWRKAMGVKFAEEPTVRVFLKETSQDTPSVQGTPIATPDTSAPTGAPVEGGDTTGTGKVSVKYPVTPAVRPTVPSTGFSFGATTVAATTPAVVSPVATVSAVATASTNVTLPSTAALSGITEEPSKQTTGFSFGGAALATPAAKASVAPTQAISPASTETTAASSGFSFGAAVQVSQPASTGFSFGAAAPTATTSTLPVTSQPASTGFSFGGTKTSQVAPTQPAASGSFGAPAQASSAASQNTSQPAFTGVNFGASIGSTPAERANTAFSFGSAAQEKPSNAGFAFGATGAPSSIGLARNAPSFASSAATFTPPASSSASLNVSTATSPSGGSITTSVFRGPSVQTTIAQNVFGSTPSATVFGQKADAPATTQSQSFTFGSSSGYDAGAPKPTLNFGGFGAPAASSTLATQATQAPVPVVTTSSNTAFGQSASQSPFTFGQGQSGVAPASSKPSSGGFSFSSGVGSTSLPSFSSLQNAAATTSGSSLPKSASGVFSFGGSASTNQPGTTATTSRPVFGSQTTSLSNATSTGSSFGGALSLFGSGSGQSSTATPTSFGSTPAATPSFGFGQPATSPPTFGQTTSAGTFGQGSSLPSYGQATSPPAFGQAASPPTFGQVASPPAFGQTTNSAFGQSTTPAFGQANPSPAFGQATSPPSFGQATSPPTFGQATSMPSTFGQATSPSFGQAAAAPAFGQTPTPAFGASAPSTATGGFNFGGPAMAGMPNPFSAQTAPASSPVLSEQARQKRLARMRAKR